MSLASSASTCRTPWRWRKPRERPRTALSDLTASLAVLAGIVLVGLLVHGIWQARRAGPRKPKVAKVAKAAKPMKMPSATTARAASPLQAGASRSDPGFGGAPVGGGDAVGGPVEPSFGPDDAASRSEGPADAGEGPASGRSLAFAARRPSRRREPQLDPLIDAYATLRLEAPLAGDAVLPHLPTVRHAGSKVLLWEGLHADTGRWEPPAPGQKYSELQAGVQLASRTGALNEIEYSTFVQRVQGVGEALGATVDVPDMLDVIARAKELDGFASQHDAQLALRLAAKGAAWSVGYLQQQARAHGFVAGVVAGRLVLPALEEGDPPVLSLVFDPQAALADEPDRSAVRDTTLAFDVPQTPQEERPFESWRDAARGLAAAMDADLVDDSGRPVGDAAFEAIGRELGTLYAALEQHDLAAGSPAARRLFS